MSPKPEWTGWSAEQLSKDLSCSEELVEAIMKKRRGIFFRPNPKGSERRPGGEHGEWWISYVCAAAHRHREKVGPKSRAIEEHHSRRLAVRRENYCPRLVKTATRPILLDDAIREFLRWARMNKKSFEDDEYRSKLLSQHFGAKTLDQIIPEMVERFKGEMVRTRSKATVNRYLALLRHLFNRAIKRGLKLSNPVSAIGLFREENTRTRWLTEEEEERLGAVIPEPYLSFCRVALYTGCRRSETFGSPMGPHRLAARSACPPDFEEWQSQNHRTFDLGPRNFATCTAPDRFSACVSKLHERFASISSMGQAGATARRSELPHLTTHIRLPSCHGGSRLANR
jgi:hypothetical protein